MGGVDPWFLSTYVSESCTASESNSDVEFPTRPPDHLAGTPDVRYGNCGWQLGCANTVVIPGRVAECGSSGPCGVHSGANC